MNWTGKRVVITGASSGIGEALAVELAGRKAALVLAARREEELDRVAERCRAAGATAVHAHPTDVARPQACHELIAASRKQLGGIDVLVNNAGMLMDCPVAEVRDISIFERLMQVNYLGPVHCTYHALPDLLASQGLIVVVSSIMGKTGAPTRSGYAASKHAVQGFFDCLRIELRGTGVDVLVVSPGAVATPIRATALGADGNRRDRTLSPDSQGISAEACARRMIRAMEKRARELMVPGNIRLGPWLKLVAPGLLDRVAARSIRRISK